MSDITFTILKVVIAVVSAVITPYLISFIRTLTSDIRYKKLLGIVETAVRAAEQTIVGSKMGEIKKDEVIKFVTVWMQEHGIQITQDELSQLIEAAVYGMKKEG